MVRGAAREFVAHLKSVEQKYPGLEYVHVSNSMGTPQERGAGAARLVREGGQASLRAGGHPLKEAKHLLELKM